MTFGAANLGTPLDKVQVKRRHAGGRPARLIDCGKHGWLTIKQIAAVAGITIHGVHARWRRGDRGETLCVHISEMRRVGFQKKGCSSPVMVAAVRLALAFPDKLPTAEQIQAIHPMTRDNAGKWRSAMRDARIRMGLPL